MTRIPTMRVGPALRVMDLAATTAVTVTDREAGNAERRRLYHSARWLRARRSFLAAHPLCAECERNGLIVAAVAVDHRDGHRSLHWRRRFWDEATWQALCLDCHNRKSAAELAEWNRGGGAAPEAP